LYPVKFICRGKGIVSLVQLWSSCEIGCWFN
jgi:hypothetical protein